MWGKLLLQFLLAAVSTICFGILMNVPRRSYGVAGIIGGLSWAFYWVIYYHLHWGLAMSNLLAAIIIGILSMLAARHLKMPMIIFNVPALVAFVPGGQAYKMVRNFVLGNNDQAWIYLYQVLVIAGAITLGFGISDVLNRVLFRRNRSKKKHV